MKALILAAGKSSRFWPLNQKHKSLIKIMGRPLIWYTLDSLRKAGMKDLVIVQGLERDIEKKLKNYKFPNLKIKYIIQREPKGMGNALFQCRNLLEDPFFVLNAERIDGGEIIEKLKTKSKKLKTKILLVGQRTEKPELYGIIKIKRDRVLEIIEKPKKGREISNIRVVGVYLLEPGFFNFYQKVKKSLYDFEDVLSLYIKKNDVGAVIIKKEIPSLKYPWQLLEMKNYLFNKFLQKKIAKNVKISKNVIIEGKVYIDKGTKVFEGATIRGPSYIGANCILGNNVLIRDHTDLENNALIGAGAEIKNSIFQDNCHTHSGFFGDSIFDKNCKIGAGVITANIRIDRGEIFVKQKIKSKKPTVLTQQRINTGLRSLGAIIGENVKIGINVSLMPGVLIGSNSIVGPNSLVMENIQNNRIFYTKFQKTIEKPKSKT